MIFKDNKKVLHIYKNGKKVLKRYKDNKLYFSETTKPNYLRFYAKDNDVHIGVTGLTLFTGLEYKKQGQNRWTAFTEDGVDLSQGDVLYLRGNGMPDTATDRLFTTSAQVECHGDCRSLLAKFDFENTPLTSRCFRFLFRDTQITTAPELPAKTLAPYCYYNMFNGCANLKNAPELPAETLATDSYYRMFMGCILINTIKCNIRYNADGTEITTSISNYWMNNMSSSGTFYKNPNWAGPTVRNTNTIPVGWTIKNIPETKNYLRFYAKDNDVHIGVGDLSMFIDLEYRLNDGDWTTFTADGVDMLKGDTLYLRGAGMSTAIATKNFTTSAPVECHGDCRSLLAKTDFENAQLTDRCFRGLFKNTQITTAPELPSMSLSYACYYELFNGCVLLKEPPKLPAKILVGYCYYTMFNKCTNLEYAPELPAEMLVDSCYGRMFYECSLINEIKCNIRYNADGTEITTNIGANWVTGVATTGTFYKNPNWAGPTVRSTNTVPSGWTIKNLPETANYLRFYAKDNDVHIGVYAFSLFIRPEYKLNDGDWTALTTDGVDMIKGDTLYLRGEGMSTSATGRSFTTSASVECHGDCRSLLSKTNFENSPLTSSCFRELFKNCLITTSPELPATELTDNCYQNMFGNCTLLTVGPNLPAEQLRTNSYTNMFTGCSLLAELKCNARYKVSGAEITDSIFYAWLSGVSATGTFYKNPNWAGPTVRNSNTIPSGWTIKDNIKEANYLRFYAKYDDVNIGVNDLTKFYNLEYNINDTEWISFTSAGVDLKQGDVLYLRGTGVSTSTSNRTFGTTDIVECYGDCRSLLSTTDFKNTPLTSTCFRGLFENTMITTPPELPATELSGACYYRMFNGCPFLRVAPELPAIKLGTSTSYYNMFTGCALLKTIKCNIMYDEDDNIITTTIGTGWLYSAPSYGTFYKNPNWSGPTVRNSNTIPSGWTILDWDENAPAAETYNIEPEENIYID